MSWRSSVDVLGSCHATLPSCADFYAGRARAVVVSEAAQRERSRTLRRDALIDELARPHLDMKRELDIDVGFRLGTEQAPES